MDTQTVKKKGISGSTLKLIAICIMVIDHIGAVLVEGRMLQILEQAGNSYPEATASHALLFTSDLLLRGIGRIAFPIFCFLIIEGLSHTRNPLKYALRLGLFGLISEIPFDLALKKTLFDWSYQNVFFTLFLGLMVIYLMQKIETAFIRNVFLRISLTAITLFLGAGAAMFLKTDYDAFGVLTIVIMYLFRKNRLYEIFSGCICLTFMSLIELPCFISLLPVKLYNGERGLNLKYVFYIFYPAHLLILYVIRVFMGI